MLKNDRTARTIGPAVLFCALFLPGYLYQNPQTAAAVFTQPSLLVQNIIVGLPQAALLLYIILTRGNETRESAGIVGFRLTDLTKILAGTVGLVIITLPGALLRFGMAEGISGTVTPDTARAGVLLLFVPVCLVTGYREELFFRSYLLTELDPFGKIVAAAAGSLLFAAGHIYQGAGAFTVTALMGVFLSWLFLRTRSIHVVALSHAAYNFLILLAGVIVR